MRLCCNAMRVAKREEYFIFDDVGEVYVLVPIFDYDVEKGPRLRHCPFCGDLLRTREQNKIHHQLQNAVKLVDKYFEDRDKSLAWFRAGNPQFGGLSALEMITRGRGDKVLKFIKESLHA